MPPRRPPATPEASADPVATVTTRPPTAPSIAPTTTEATTALHAKAHQIRLTRDQVMSSPFGMDTTPRSFSVGLGPRRGLLRLVSRWSASRLASSSFDAQQAVHRVPRSAWRRRDLRGLRRCVCEAPRAQYQDKATVAAINTSLTAACTTVSSSASASSTSAWSFGRI